MELHMRYENCDFLYIPRKQHLQTLSEVKFFFQPRQSIHHNLGCMTVFRIYFEDSIVWFVVVFHING